MHFTNRLGGVLAAAAVFMTATATVLPAQSAQAASCYGASCSGLDPQGRCSGDARTVAAKAVAFGMLELRYSPSCAANWGRYTPDRKTAYSYFLLGIGITARVTVWNPGKQSYDTAHWALGIQDTSWSFMTDGRPTACTGVEVITVKSNQHESQGWAWGPCA